MPQEIPLFGIGTQSKSSNITAAHRVNLYYDIQTSADKAAVVAYGTPGLELFSSVSASQTRGMRWMETNNTLYVIQRGDLWAVAADGTATLKKALTALNPTDITGRVSMSDNGTQLIIVTGTYGYVYVPGTNTITDISASLPAGGCDTVTFLDSYFIVNRNGTGQFYLSNSYDGLTWNGLNYATAESSSDNLTAVIADKGTLVLFGTSSTEIWINSGALAFTFQRVNGAPSMVGIASKWSLSRTGDFLTGLFRNKYGNLIVGRLNGYTVEPISDNDLNYLINSYVTPTDAVGFGYSLNGRHFYEITFQNQGVTWLYSAESGSWSQLKSFGTTRHMIDQCVAFGGLLIAADYQTGSLYNLTARSITDNGLTIERELIGGHIFTTGRNKTVINRLRIDLEGGVASTAANAPNIMLSISRDNGHTWGAELWTTIGKLSEFSSRAEWRRLGQARDWLFKIRITDSIKTVIMQAVIEGKELNK